MRLLNQHLRRLCQPIILLVSLHIILLASLHNILPVSKMLVTEGPETVSKKKNVTEGTETVSMKKNDLPPDGNLRVLLTEGCSGSSIVMILTREILSRHGFSVRGGEWELPDPRESHKHKIHEITELKL